MLQQTRVAAVLGYYRRFLEALPDIPALAAVEEEQLMKLWEGLGYYSRARNLKKAAAEAVERYGGRLPDSYEELLTPSGDRLLHGGSDRFHCLRDRGAGRGRQCAAGDGETAG